MSKLTREEVYKIIDGERVYQDKRWERKAPLSPSDSFRVIEVLLKDAHEQWYYDENTTVINGVEVAKSDMNTMRKIAAIAVDCMERFGVEPRKNS